MRRLRPVVVVALVSGVAIPTGYRFLPAAVVAPRGLFVPQAPRRAPPLPLVVASHGPVDAVAGRQPLKLRFDRAVVALGAEDDVPPTFLTLSPHAPGRARWVGPDVLVYEPDAPWLAATRFTARVAPTFAALDGARVQRDRLHLDRGLGGRFANISRLARDLPAVVLS